MYAVRNSSGKVVARFQTRVEAEACVLRTAKSPMSSTTDRLLSGSGPYYYEHDRELAVLLDLAKPVLNRKLPPQGASVVYDRSYEALARDGFIRWHQPNAHTSSYEDRYELTDKGAKAVRIYQEFVRGIAGKYKRNAGRSPARAAGSPRLPRAKINAAVEAARMYAGSEGLPIKTRQRFYTKLMHHCAAVAKATGNTEANVFEQITARAQSLGRVYPRPAKDY